MGSFEIDDSFDYQKNRDRSDNRRNVPHNQSIKSSLS